MSHWVVTDSPGEKRMTVIVRAESGAKRDERRYLMPTHAHLTVREGEEVHAGDVLAKIPRATTKTKDITGGLSRVVELFEARKPRETAIIAEINGLVKYGDVTKGQRKLVIRGDNGQEREYLVPRGVRINVQEGERIKAGDPLMDGPHNPHDILDVLGETELQKSGRLASVIYSCRIWVGVRGMSAVPGLSKSPDPELIRAELDAVLASEVFSRAPSLGQFLKYICRKALDGQAEHIKEYNVAVEAFGRHPDFDQKEDAIVRVEAHRLRKRLKHYYETEGAGHAVQIMVPPGQYVPVFVDRRHREVEVLPPVSPVPIEIPLPVSRKPRRRGRLLAAAIMLVTASTALLGLLFRRPETAPAEPAVGIPASAPASEEGIRIAAGFRAPKYVDSSGNTWLSDRYYLGGNVVLSPVEKIHRTNDVALFHSRREGDFRYDIPLTPGNYELHLLFAERVFGSGNLAGGGETSRLFHVFANGLPLVEQLDVINDASGSNTADERVFKGISPAPDGFLHLQFSPSKEKAFVNGIAVIPAPPGKISPIRILAGIASYRDSAGRLWTGDRYSLGGQIVTRTETIAGTQDTEMYQTERYGNFSYAIPVADGRYAVTLHFTETWFGPNKRAGGGAGSRAFDVYCNGRALLKDFDVFKAAGGENRAVQKTFRGLTPNAQGKLALSFVPVKNYASLNAIEVVAEGR